MTTVRKVWSILTKEQAHALILLMMLMLVGMALEMAGIGLVIPAIALMTQDDLAIKYPLLGELIRYLGNPDRDRLIMYGMVTMVGVFTLRATFLGLLSWKQMRFIYGVQANLSQRLFSNYLAKPYTFHLERNSSELIRNVTHETSVFTVTGLMSGMMVLTELLVLTGVSALLLFVEPVGTLMVVSILCVAGVGFSRLAHSYVLKWGKARQYHEGLRLQHLQQGLGGVKDVKLLGRETGFIDNYNLHNYGTTSVSARQATLQALPRLWLELLAVSGLAILVVVMLSGDRPLSDLLPTLGLFAAAAFRLMPSVNRIISGIQGVGFALPVVDNLHAELQNEYKSELNSSADLLPFERNIVLESLCFQYPSSENYALKDINLTIRKGDCIGFIGESGAGKSTLVDVILGLLEPVKGAVKVDGLDIKTQMRRWQNLIGYVPQSIFLTDDSLRRNIAFGVADNEINDDALLAALKSAQLKDFVGSLPLGLDTMVGERGVRLSGGQLQRIGIARALYHNPAVLVLDEATSALDTATEREVMEAVRTLKRDKTILIVAHRLSTVKDCDCIYRLNQGELFEDVEVKVLNSKG